MTDADDIDGLAAEYVLGSLDPIQRAEIAVRRERDPSLDDAIKAWETRLGPLSGALPDFEPPHHVLRNVMRRIQEPREQRSAPAKPASSKQGPKRWLTFAAGASAMAACLVAVLVWIFEAPVRTPAKFFAELQKIAYPKDGTTTATAIAPLGFEVYFDLRASTVLIMPFAVPPGSRRDYQLWLMPGGSAPPISLGIIPLIVATTSPWPATYPPYDLVHAMLAVSLEPEGGSSKGIPTGPMVFVGKLVQVM
jgi:anti-sigma-K factor RskA